MNENDLYHLSSVAENERVGYARVGDKGLQVLHRATSWVYCNTTLQCLVRLLYDAS